MSTSSISARRPFRRAAFTLVIGTTLVLIALTGHAQDGDRSSFALWYDEPAPAWNQALPIGNGRLGAMVFGGIERERIQLNEETLWSGGPYDPVVEGAHEALPEIRRHLFAGDFERAHDLFGRTMMGVPYEMMKYQPFADLWLDFPGHEGATEYVRELDLADGVATVSYVVDGTTYRREVFSSAVDQVVAVRITADRPGAVTFSANLHGVRNPAHSNYGTDYFLMDGLPPNELRVTGKSSDYLGIEGRLRYEGRVRARVSGGTSEVDYRTLHVRNADEAVLFFAAATSFVDYQDVLQIRPPACGRARRRRRPQLGDDAGRTRGGAPIMVRPCRAEPGAFGSSESAGHRVCSNSAADG